MIAYGGELLEGLTVILPSFISSIPFLFQIPCTVTRVSTTLPRVMIQVKVRSRPWKKLVFRGDPEMMGGGGVTACDKTNNYYAMQYHNNNCYEHKSIHRIETFVVLSPETSTPASGMESLAVQVYLPA